jgi:drug/metabolite transporter (DMT)-like permease
MPADRATFAAFIGVVVIAGVNFVAVRFSNRELPPFEGAALRFAAAAVLFFAYVRVRGIALPRGRGLVGATLFGVLAFFGAYAFAYWGLVSAPAGLGSLAFALVPLITPVLAVAHGLEALRPRGLAGGAIAALGIAVVFSDQLAATVPLPSMLALLAAAACAAESGVVVKYFPRSHPAATNAVAMSVGTIALVALSLATREAWVLPVHPATIAAFAYLVVSTVALFALALYVIGRWTATAFSYQFPLAPMVTVIAAAVLAGEGVGAAFLGGGALVLLGVLLAATGRAPAREPAASLRPA